MLWRASNDRHYQNRTIATIASNRTVHPPALRTIPMHRRDFVLGISHFTPGTPTGKQWMRVQKF